MTIDKAISNLRELEETLHYYHRTTMKEALELSIEALRRLKGDRVADIVRKDLPLPGETEE